MGRVTKIDEVLWVKLSAAARRSGRTPESVIRGLIRDFVQVETDRMLDKGIAMDVQSSGYREGDAVRLVREYRRQARI